MTPILRPLFLIFVLGVIATLAAPADQGEGQGHAKGDGVFTLTVLHNNDMHARFRQTNAQSGKCSHKQMAQNQCYGGFARVAHVVKEIKNKEKNVIFLNAGDTYQGTVWYTIHKWPVVAEFIQKIGLDAMSLGNHEFDDGVAGLAPFLANITVPVLGANLNLSREPSLAENLKPSTILEVGGHKIGVIGYLTPETMDISSPGNVGFTDEVAAIKKEANKLKAQGVKILIAVGHSGFGTDKKIAREVEDIDLVIGGHTNTFLYTGDQPDSEAPVGLYPTMVDQPSGRMVPVVSAYAYTKYMGRVKLTFNEEGEVTHYEGNPLLLDRTVPQDQSVLDAMVPWEKKLDEKAKQELGRTRVYLNGSQAACRMMECNMGNLITDAYVTYNAWLRTSHEEGWTDAAIGVLNGGGIRSSISEQEDNGTVTMEHVLSVLPYQNSIINLRLEGRYLRDMLEVAVADYDPTGVEAPGKFLQVSGLQVTFDLARPPGSRLVSVLARCADCRVPVYEEVSSSKKYRVITTAYLADGSDGYSVIKEHAEDRVILDASESDIVAAFIKKKSPVSPGLEGRVRLLNRGAGSAATLSARARRDLPAAMLAVLAIARFVRG